MYLWWINNHHWIAALKEISLILTPLILVAGFYLAWRQFDAIRRARMAELIIRLYEGWDAPLMEGSRQKLSEINDAEAIKNAIIGAEKSENLYPLIRVANFFDTVGSLVCHGFLDKKIAYDLMGTAFETYDDLYASILHDPQRKAFLRCFRDLGEIFTKEKASRSNVQARRTSPFKVVKSE